MFGERSKHWFLTKGVPGPSVEKLYFEVLYHDEGRGSQIPSYPQIEINHGTKMNVLIEDVISTLK